MYNFHHPSLATTSRPTNTSIFSYYCYYKYSLPLPLSVSITITIIMLDYLQPSHPHSSLYVLMYNSAWRIITTIPSPSLHQSTAQHTPSQVSLQPLQALSFIQTATLNISSQMSSQQPLSSSSQPQSSPEVITTTTITTSRITSQLNVKFFW